MREPGAFERLKRRASPRASFAAAEATEPGRARCAFQCETSFNPAMHPTRPTSSRTFTKVTGSAPVAML